MADSPLQTMLKTRFLVGNSIPTTGAELEKALQTALVNLTDTKAGKKDSVLATIDNPPNIKLLQANLSGVGISLTSDTAEAAASKVSTDIGGEKDRVPAVLDKLMVKAHPLKVDGIPAEFDLQVEKIPFNWITDKKGQVWIGANTDDLEPVSGEFAARIEKSALKEAVREAVKVGVAKHGFTLQHLDFDIKQDGERFLVAGQAKVKRSIISATANARAQVTYDPKNFVLRVETVAVDSANPAISMILKMAQGSIDRVQGKKFDLNALLAGTGQQLTAADVTVSADDVRVTGKFS